MKLLRINAENIYLHDEPADSVVKAGYDAVARDYQFMIHQGRLWLIAYWRDGGRPDYLEFTDIEAEEIQRFRAEIEAEIAEGNR